MDVAVTTEQHFFRTPDGSVWVRGDEDRGFFGRYLAVFAAVHVVARVGNVAERPTGTRRADGPGVGFAALPEFRGAGAWVRSAPRALATAAGHLQRDGLCRIIRAPGGVASIVWLVSSIQHAPYGVEVVADPELSFSREAYGSAEADVLRPLAVGLLRAQTARASAAAYVTERTLQRKYPTAAPSFSYSSVDLPDEVFELASQTLSRLQSDLTDVLMQPRLVFVGRLRLPFKGLDVLLKVLAQLRIEGFMPRLDVVGGGELLDDYRQQAKDLGIAEFVSFVGEVRADGVRARLTQADVFVLPTRREGLPRAVIEAMAVGLPCVSTSVAGIPELLPEDLMSAPDDVEGFSRCLRRLLDSRARRLAESARNAAHAQRYRRQSLDSQRQSFYRALVEARSDG